MRSDSEQTGIRWNRPLPFTASPLCATLQHTPVSLHVYVTFYGFLFTAFQYTLPCAYTCKNPAMPVCMNGVAFFCLSRVGCFSLCPALFHHTNAPLFVWPLRWHWCPRLPSMLLLAAFGLPCDIGKWSKNGNLEGCTSGAYSVFSAKSPRSKGKQIPKRWRKASVAPSLALSIVTECCKAPRCGVSFATRRVCLGLPLGKCLSRFSDNTVGCGVVWVKQKSYTFLVRFSGVFKAAISFGNLCFAFLHFD